VDATDNTDGGSSIDRTFDERVFRYVKLTVVGAATYTGPWVSVSELRIGCSGLPVSSREPVASAATTATVRLYPMPATSKLVVGDLPGMLLLSFTGAGRPVLTRKVTVSR